MHRLLTINELRIIYRQIFDETFHHHQSYLGYDEVLAKHKFVVRNTITGNCEGIYLTDDEIAYILL